MEFRNRIVNAARICDKPEMNGIRVKKDMHPSVRNEWKRLFEAKEAELRKPENAGKVVELDLKKRQITCDGLVIDSWSNMGF